MQQAYYHKQSPLNNVNCKRISQRIPEYNIFYKKTFLAIMDLWHRDISDQEKPYVLFIWYTSSEITDSVL